MKIVGLFQRKIGLFLGLFQENKKLTPVRSLQEKSLILARMQLSEQDKRLKELPKKLSLRTMEKQIGEIKEDNENLLKVISPLLDDKWNLGNIVWRVKFSKAREIWG